MRYRIYAIVHLIILVFYIGRPVIPYIQYAIFKDFIAKNLCVNKDEPKSCCQGKCYLEKQLKKSSETPDTKNKTHNNKAQNKEVKEFMGSCIFIHNLLETNFQYLTIVNIAKTSRNISPVFIPPELKS